MGASIRRPARGAVLPLLVVAVLLAAAVAYAVNRGSNGAGASANGRYFVDQTGAPILVRGDSPWSTPTGCSSSPPERPARARRPAVRATPRPECRR